MLLHRVRVVRPPVGGGGGGAGGGGGGELAVGGTLQLELLDQGGDLEIISLCGNSNDILIHFIYLSVGFDESIPAAAVHGGQTHYYFLKNKNFFLHFVRNCMFPPTHGST